VAKDLTRDPHVLQILREGKLPPHLSAHPHADL